MILVCCLAWPSTASTCTSGECFVTAASSPAQIDAYNRLMAVFSAIYVGASLALTRTDMHSAGFIAANCINMGLRFAYAVFFIARYFHPYNLRPLRDAIPGVATLAAYGASAVALHVSQSRMALAEATGQPDYNARGLHVTVGAACLLATASVVYIQVHGITLTVLRPGPPMVTTPAAHAIAGRTVPARCCCSLARDIADKGQLMIASSNVYAAVIIGKNRAEIKFGPLIYGITLHSSQMSCS